MKSVKFNMNMNFTKPYAKSIKQHRPRLTSYVSSLSLSTPQTTNIIIYVLCYNETTYNFAKHNYSKYKWAKPILMKYQDYTFENAFWKQLMEISNEWENCDMVGTISYKAYKKINLEKVNHIIMNKLYSPKMFYAFLQSSGNRVFNENVHTVEFRNLIKYMSASLNNSVNYNISSCNYWMTTPELMKQFIEWHINVCLPILLKHPHCFNNSEYKEGTLNETTLLKLCGRPYYPNIPFILERINLIFFVRYF